MKNLLSVLSNLLVAFVAIFALLLSSCTFFKFKTSCNLLRLNIRDRQSVEVKADIGAGEENILREVRLFESLENGQDFIVIRSPDKIDGSITYTLPVIEGKENYVLTWQKGNIMEWKDISSVTLGGVGNIQVITTPGNTTQESNQGCNSIACVIQGDINLQSDITGILPLGHGGTGSSLDNPGEDSILFWDSSSGKIRWLKIGDNLDIDDNQLNSEGGSVISDGGSYEGGIYTAGNGLNVAGSEVRLGGALNQNTTISQGNYDLTYNLTGTGSFNIQDNGQSAFFVGGDGLIGIGTTDPSYRLEIYQDSIWTRYVEEPSYNLYSSGINDLTVAGEFTGDEPVSYSVYISSEGNPDTFSWFGDDGYGEQDVFITGGTQPLSHGIYVSFSNTTGHISFNDSWSFAAVVEETPLYDENLFGVTNWNGDSILRVDSYGNIGFGTNSPEERLTLSGGNFSHYAEGDPVLKGLYDDFSVQNVYVSGNYAYITGSSLDYQDWGLQIIDVSNPSSPSLAGFYSGVSGKVLVIGNYAYIGGGSSLNIIDISNPTSPTLIGTYDSGSLWDFDISGKYAYITRGTDGISIVDISDPTSLSLVGTYDEPYFRENTIRLSGKFAYVNSRVQTNGNNYFRIFDVSNPASPLLVGSHRYGSFMSDPIADIDISGKYAYLAETDGRLIIYDVSNPSSPSLISSISAGFSLLGVQVSGNYAYISSLYGEDGGGWLRVMDISNPASPIIIGSYYADDYFTGYAYGVFVSGKYAYLAEGNTGLLIVDINGIETPTLNAGNIWTSDLSVVKNADIGNNLNIRNALNVGPGGLYSQGPTSIMLGAGVTAPHTALTVNQLGTGDILNLFNSTKEVLTVTSDGNLGIGTTAPEYSLDIAGTIRAQNFLTQGGMPVNDILIPQEVRNYSIAALTGSYGLSTTSFEEKVPPATFAGVVVPVSVSIALPNGNVFIAYEDLDNSRYATFVIYDSEGNIVKSPTVFNSAQTEHYSVTVLDDENILIAYADYNVSGAFVIYDSAGNLVKSETVFNNAAITSVTATTLTNGNVLITYNDYGDSGYGELVIYDSDGNLVRSANTFSDTSTYLNSAATLTNGNVFLAYADLGNSNAGTFVIFDSVGDVVKSKTVFTSGSIIYQNISVITLNNGNILVAYTDDGNSSYGTFIIYDPAGNLVRSETVYSDAEAYNNSATVLPNGNVLIAYADGGNSDAGTFKILDSSGDVIQNATVFDYDGAYSNSAITLNNGNVLISYTNGTIYYGMFTIWGSSGASFANLVGIGTTAPTSKLEIVGAGSDASTSSLWIKNALGDTSLFVNDLGYVGIGTADPFSALHIWDKLTLSGQATYLSSAQLGDFQYSLASKAYVDFQDNSRVLNGNLTHIDFDDQGDSAYGVWGDGKFIYLANYGGGLHTYSVDSSGNLTHIDSDDQGDAAVDVWGDGKFIYLANSTGGIHTYSVDSQGYLTHIDSDDQGDVASGVWGDGKFMYLANHTGGIHTYSVDSQGYLTHIDSDDQGDYAMNVWGDGKFIYLANDAGGIHTYSVDSQGYLTHIDSDDQGDWAMNVWGDGKFIYLANNAGGIHTYSVDSSGNLTHIDFDDQGDSAYGVWGDGKFIYLANSTGGLHTYSVDSQGYLTHIDSDDQGDNAIDVWGDGKFIYLANYGGGLHTYSVNSAYEYDKANQFSLFTGSVGIGTTYPSSILEIIGTGSDSSTSSLWIKNILGDTGLYVNDLGYVGIGTTDPTRALQSTGTVRFSAYGAGTLVTDADGNVSVSSDERLKDIEGEFTRGLSAILELDPILYKWNRKSGMDTEETYAGLSAQDVRDAIPEAVDVGPDGYLTLSDRPILAAAINAIKEQQSQIDELRESMLGDLTLNESTESTTSQNPTGVLSQIQIMFEEFKEMLLTLGMTSHTDELGNDYLSIDSDVKMAGDLSVLGETTTSDLMVTGNLQMGLITINTEENSIDVLGVSCYDEEAEEDSEFCTDTINETTLSTLYLQKSSRGNLDVFNGKLVIEPNGNMKLDGNLEIQGTTKTDKLIITEPVNSEQPETSGDNIELTSCEEGEISWDDNYIYVCTSLGTWKKSPLYDISE